MRDRRRVVWLVVSLAAMLSLGAGTVRAGDPYPGPAGRLKALDVPAGPPTLDRIAIDLGLRVPDPSLGGTWTVAATLFAFAPGWTPDAALGRVSMRLPGHRCSGGSTPTDPSDDVVVDLELIGRPEFALDGTVSPLLRGATATGTLRFAYAPISDPCPAGSDPVPAGTFSAPVTIRVSGRGPVSIGWLGDVLRFSRAGSARVTVDGRQVSVDPSVLSRDVGWS